MGKAAKVKANKQVKIDKNLAELKALKEGIEQMDDERSYRVVTDSGKAFLSGSFLSGKIWKALIKLV